MLDAVNAKSSPLSRYFSLIVKFVFFGEPAAVTSLTVSRSGDKANDFFSRDYACARRLNRPLRGMQLRSCDSYQNKIILQNVLAFVKSMSFGLCWYYFHRAGEGKTNTFSALILIETTPLLCTLHAWLRLLSTLINSVPSRFASGVGLG